MDYLWLKTVHASLALISISGFVLRWFWRMSESPMAGTRWVRITPHVVDSLFLLSAISMIYMAGQVPIGVDWLSAKLGGLALYIVLGLLAMRTAPQKSLSLPFFLAAMIVFGWIVSVAFLKTPLGLFTI